jgi:hypothetical protein
MKVGFQAPVMIQRCEWNSCRQCSGSGSTGSTWFLASQILLSSSKNSKENLDSYCSVTYFELFIFEK